MTQRSVLLAFLLSTGISAPALAGPWTVGQQTITYTASHPIGDGSNARGGEAPAYAYEADDVADNFTQSTWLHTSPPGGQYDGPGVGNEKKARFDCNVAFENHNDPILAPGVANGATHDHTFFGNTSASTNTQNVTYPSLRAAGNSTCYGGPLNRTLYWEPSVKMTLANGAEATIRPKNIVTYYEDGGISIDNGIASRWPRGLRFIEGLNMSDPTNTRVSTIIAAANAASTPGRYTAVAAATGGGFVGWKCVNPTSGNGSIATSPIPGSDFQPWLKNADGTPTLSCGAGEIYFELLSDPCWDGKNLDSPNGRLHMMPWIRDNTLSKNVCPDGWYHVMRFRAKVTFNTLGSAAEATNWHFSSDRMAGMTQFENGRSGHFDLIPAWSYGNAAAMGPFLRFSVSCDGISILMDGTSVAGDPHECGFGRLDSAGQLWVNEASPDGSSPNPLVNLNPDQSTTVLRYFPGVTGNPIPGTIHNSH